VTCGLSVVVDVAVTVRVETEVWVVVAGIVVVEISV
jgi:hypothetical protein